MSTPPHDMLSRQQNFIDSYTSVDLSKLLSFHSKKTVYSDYGAQPRGILNLDFARFSKFAGFMFAQDFKMKTRGISGTMDFVAWEWDCSLTFKTAPPPGFFKGVTGAGQSVKLRGVSLINWAQEGGEWKIVKQDDYGKILEERENEEEDGLQRDSS